MVENIKDYIHFSLSIILKTLKKKIFLNENFIFVICVYQAISATNLLIIKHNFYFNYILKNYLT